jgi:hypothetical protein
MPSALALAQLEHEGGQQCGRDEGKDKPEHDGGEPVEGVVPCGVQHQVGGVGDIQQHVTPAHRELRSGRRERHHRSLLTAGQLHSA